MGGNGDVKFAIIGNFDKVFAKTNNCASAIAKKASFNS
jgi:hypothetical protein